MLEESIKLREENDGNPDAKNWGYEEGILISTNEAKSIIKYLGYFTLSDMEDLRQRCAENATAFGGHKIDSNEDTIVDKQSILNTPIDFKTDLPRRECEDCGTVYYSKERCPECFSL